MIKKHLHRYELVFRDGEPYVYNKNKDAYHVLAQCNIGECEAQSALWADKDYVEQLDKWISEHDAPILLETYTTSQDPGGVISTGWNLGKLPKKFPIAVSDFAIKKGKK